MKMKLPHKCKMQIHFQTYLDRTIIWISYDAVNVRWDSDGIWAPMLLSNVINSAQLHKQDMNKNYNINIRIFRGSPTIYDCTQTRSED